MRGRMRKLQEYEISVLGSDRVVHKYYRFNRWGAEMRATEEHRIDPSAIITINRVVEDENA